jgi:hypothetical protein
VRSVRVTVAEFLIETGEVIQKVGAAVRDLGGFCLPSAHPRYPGFVSNGDIDSETTRYRVPAT